jgi:pyruvate dehydrogenase (quinone)
VGSHYQQEVNLTLLFEDVTVYNQQVINPNQVSMITSEACRHALNSRGVAHISFPVDYQVEKLTGKHSEHYVKGGLTSEWSHSSSVPPAAELANAADLLNKVQRVAILVGQGALGAREEVLELAERLGAPIVKALLGKAVVPDDHPLTTGGLGLLGTAPSQEAMEECDTLLIIGSSFPYAEYLPKPAQARGIQLDDKANRIGLRFPVDIGLVGDAKRTLQQLLPLIEAKTDRRFLHKSQKSAESWWKLVRERGTRKDKPIKPQRVAWELSELVSDSAIISTDSGTVTGFLAQHFRIRGDQKFSCSGTLATMAPALPYAIAAKLAFPERQSIAFVGDGGFTMLMGDFATAVKYDLPIVCVILKNNSLGQIKWEQIVFLGNPEYGVDLHPIDFAKFAEACGGVGFFVENPEEVGPTIQKALALNRPCVVEVAVDPYEPPIPPKVSAKQATHFAEALMRGEPNGGQIALTIFRDKFTELL